MTEPKDCSPQTDETRSLLLHPAAEQALVAVSRVADELAKLNASMDKLIGAKGDSIRPAVEALAEQLISFLDATSGDPDFEDVKADDEPSLGAPDIINQGFGWKYPGNREDLEIELGSPDMTFNQLFHEHRFGSQDGREEENEHHDGEGMSKGCDDEPSLGSLDGRMSQLRWGQPDRQMWFPNTDLELDEAEQEVGVEDEPHDAERTHEGW